MNEVIKKNTVQKNDHLVEGQRHLWHALCRERLERPWRVPSVAELAVRAEVPEVDAIEYFAACELARLVRVHPGAFEHVDVAGAPVRSYVSVRAGLAGPLTPAMRLAPDPDWPHLHPAPVVTTDPGPFVARYVEVPGLARMHLHYRPDGEVVEYVVWDLRPHGAAA